MKLIKRITSVILAVTAAVGLSGCSGGGKPGNIGDVVLNAGDKIAEITIEGYGTIKAKLFPDIAPVGVENFIALAEEGYYDGLKIHRVVENCCIQGGSLNGDGTGGVPAVNDGKPLAAETSVNARNFYGALGYADIGGSIATQFYIVNCKKTQDLSGYDVEKMKAKAAEYAKRIEGLTEEDPAREVLTIQNTYYTNMADFFSKASEDVAAKYATVGGYPFWDGNYTIFGQVYEGLDIVDKISSVKLTTCNTGEVSLPVEDITIESVKITEYAPPAPEQSSSSKKKK